MHRPRTDASSACGHSADRTCQLAREHSSSSFRSQAMRRLLRRGASARRRDWRGQNDGGYNASAVNQEPDGIELIDLLVRITTPADMPEARPTGNRAHQPAQHRQRSGAHDLTRDICKPCGVHRRVRFTRAGELGYELFSRSPGNVSRRKENFYNVSDKERDRERDREIPWVKLLKRRHETGNPRDMIRAKSAQVEV